MITVTIIAMTFMYTVLTAPAAYVEYDLDKWRDTNLLNISDCMSFSYHALNFIMLSISNKVIFNSLCKLVKFILCNAGKKQIQITGTLNS
jgi:hypothetical protein